MLIAKELAGFSGASADDLRKAIGKKKRDKMALLEPEFRRRLRRARACRRRPSTGCGQTNEKSADYSFNKSHAACYGLIGYRTAWLKANYPAEYMAALISSVMDTKDKVPFFVAQTEADGHRDPPARRQRVRPRVHRPRALDPLRARRGQGRRLRRGRGDQGRARAGGRLLHVDLGLLRARRRPRGQQEGDRGADQVRRLRLDRRVAGGDARRARAGPGRGAEVPARRADRPGLDLRPRRRGRRLGRRRGLRRAHAPADPLGRGRAVRAARRGRRSRSASSSPPIRSRTCARRCRPRPTRRWPR